MARISIEEARSSNRRGLTDQEGVSPKFGLGEWILTAGIALSFAMIWWGGRPWPSA